jgi:hypothetical protein
MRTISVLPSFEVVESLARPWQRMKTPQAACPSTRTTACSGKTAACFIWSKARSVRGARSQKKLREWRWQLIQLSTQLKPEVLIGAPLDLFAQTRERPGWASNDLRATIFEISWLDRPMRTVIAKRLHAGNRSISGEKLSAFSVN